jgi:hypothetical protein
MPRRPAFLPATAAICALLALTACQGSPEAGRPNTTSTSPSATPTPSSPSTPTWTPEEQDAITAATARYVVGHAAIDRALNDPVKPSRAPLEAAGLSGERIIAAIGDVRTLRENGWYRAGASRITSLTPQAVELDGEQSVVTLRSCVDSSSTVLHFQKDRKVVPVGPSSSKRNVFTAKLIYAGRSGATTKMWFLTEEKAIGTC